MTDKPKVILAYPPFCTPASPPYSITNIYAFINANYDGSLGVIDLNVKFHGLRFSKFKEYYQGLISGYDNSEYDSMTKKYREETHDCYAENNRKIREGKEPEYLKELVDLLVSEKPDVVAFSIVYSSQVFYCKILCDKLRALGIKVVIGGPGVSDKLKESADECLANELELLEYVKFGNGGEKIDHETLNFDYSLDFSKYDKEDYFVPSLVIPIRTTSACYYRQCTFCTHYQGTEYYEYDMQKIEDAISRSSEFGVEYIFIVDDMIHKKRILALAEIFKKYNMKWMCQLKPNSDYDKETLRVLYESGLRVCIWGVESGNDRILGLMKKGTSRVEVEGVLRSSASVGIKNVVYIMFGFPSETREEFMDTISLLEHESDSIDLISTSIFGLQKGTVIYQDPSRFGIVRIDEQKRTLLDSKYSYKVSSGLSSDEANKLRRSYKGTIDKLCKYPRMMNFFREHMLVLSE